MPADKRLRAYTLYSFVRFLVEEVILAIILSWFLPMVGIRIPLWLLIVLMETWAFYSFLISNLVEKSLIWPTNVGTEAMIGLKGSTTTPLSLDGYIRVGTELWHAHSMAGDIEAGIEVIIVSINGLTLYVKPSTNTNPLLTQ